MKKFIIFLVFLCLLGGGKAFADSSSGVKIIRDEKYGRISNKFFIYLSLTHKWKKTAVLNLAKVFGGYQRTIDADADLQREGMEFQTVRDAMVRKVVQGQMDKSVVIKYDSDKRLEIKRQRDDMVRSILTEIQKTVSEYALKNQIRAVVNDRIPNLKGDEADVTNEILKILNNHYALVESKQAK